MRRAGHFSASGAGSSKPRSLAAVKPKSSGSMVQQARAATAMLLTNSPSKLQTRSSVGGGANKPLQAWVSKAQDNKQDDKENHANGQDMSKYLTPDR